MYCQKCGKEINDDAVVCINCGCAVDNKLNNINNEQHDWLITMVLSWVLGGIGAHRFYTGHIGSGIAQLLTVGGCGIWAFIDWVSICFNGFRDIDNKPLNNYKKELGVAIFIGTIFLSIIIAIAMSTDV